MSTSKIKKLQLQLADIEKNIPYYQTSNTKVSKASIGWQLDHSLKVINGVMQSLIHSNPEDFKSEINLARVLLFGFNYIPRGRGKAPKVVMPPKTILKEDLVAQLERAMNYIKKIDDVNKNQYFKHLIFGMLSKKQTLQFLVLHTHHHLKIVRDILRQ